MVLPLCATLAVLLYAEKERGRQQLAPAATGALSGSDSAAIVRKVVDLGELSPGEERRVPFCVPNRSRTVWNVRRTKTSCGCLKVDLTNSTVAPGDALCGTATVRAGARANERAYSSSIEIELDGDIPSVWVECEGNVLPTLICEPSQITFAQGDETTGHSVRQATLYAMMPGGAPALIGRTPAWITEIQVSSSDVLSSGSAPSHAMSSWDASFHWDPALVPHDGEGVFRFHLKGETPAVVEVPYTVGVDRESVEVFPSQLFFGEMRVGDEATRHVVIVRRGADTRSKRTAPVVQVPQDLAASVQTVVEVKDTLRCVLQVTLRPAEAGFLESAIVVRNVEDRELIVRVPVVANVGQCTE